MEALVGLLGAGEAGVLAHGPRAAAIAVGADAAGVRVLPGIAEGVAARPLAEGRHRNARFGRHLIVAHDVAA